MSFDVLQRKYRISLISKTVCVLFDKTFVALLLKNPLQGNEVPEKIY